MNHLIVLVLEVGFGLVLLYYGAEWLVRGGKSIALRVRVSPLIIGLTLVAFGTSAPELFVSVGAALSGLGDVCIGNAVGSNTCNIALILGLSALVAPVTVNPALLRRDLPVMLITAIVVSGLCLTFGGIGRVAGVFFLLGLIAYTLMGVVSSNDDTQKGAPELEPVLSVLAVVGGLLALICGAQALLDGAVTIEKSMGVPDEVVALTVVAVGTSLPELATSVIAAREGESDIAIGNVVGSNIFNILGVLGASALIRPVAIEGMDAIDFVVMILASAFLWGLMKARGRLGRCEGAFLLFSYAAYVIWLFVSA